MAESKKKPTVGENVGGGLFVKIVLYQSVTCHPGKS